MKKKIKVLHLTHTDIYDDNRILKELEALSDCDKYEILSMGVKDSGGGSRTGLVINAKVKLLALVTKKFVFLPKFLRHGFNLIELCFPMFYCGVRFRPVVVHCHDTLVLPVGCLISICTGAKLIYDAHELESDKNGQSKIISLSTLLIEKICWPRIKALISVSPSILNWYSAKLGAKKNALILNSPLISNVFKEDDFDGYFHRLYDIPADKLIFIYLGMLENGRGIQILLEAFSDMELNSHVVFIGHGSLDKQILAATKKSKNIHLHKPVPHEAVVGLVKNADIGLCVVEKISLSDYYCLPNKLFEYGFAGLPVLGSNFPDIESFVTKYQLGIVTKIDFKSVTNAVKAIEKNPPCFNSKNISELSWQQQANKLTDLYSEVLSEIHS